MTQTNVRTTTANVDNGVNVAALIDARGALEAAPEAAQFKWRTTCEWVNGTHSRSTIEGFFGLGEEQSRGKTFTVEADHPEVFAAEDHAPTPVEIVLSGLASCLTAGVAAVAQHRGIQLHSVKATVEGDMDIQGILGIDDEQWHGPFNSPSGVHFVRVAEHHPSSRPAFDAAKRWLEQEWQFAKSREIVDRELAVMRENYRVEVLQPEPDA